MKKTNVLTSSLFLLGLTMSLSTSAASAHNWTLSEKSCAVFTKDLCNSKKMSTESCKVIHKVCEADGRVVMESDTLSYASCEHLMREACNEKSMQSVSKESCFTLGHMCR